MRIIGGSAGGRRIRAPSGQATRPTSDRVKEALFNILGPPAEDAAVLDLYAGSGALGLEALSRGATRAVFVDGAQASAKTIVSNARDLGFENRVRVLRADVRATLSRLARTESAFEWIFIDPPYAEDEAVKTIAALGDACAALVAEDAVVIVEYDRRRPPPERTGNLVRRDQRRYGDTEVAFYERAE